MIDHSHSTAATNLVAIDVAKEWNVALVQEPCGRRQHVQPTIAKPGLLARQCQQPFAQYAVVAPASIPVSEAQEVKQLREENSRLKKLVADL